MISILESINALNGQIRRYLIWKIIETLVRYTRLPFFFISLNAQPMKSIKHWQKQ